MKTTKGKTSSVKLKGLIRDGTRTSSERRKDRQMNIQDGSKELRNRSPQAEFQNQNLHSK